MSKQDAKDLIQQGCKLSHKYFGVNEFIFCLSGILYNKDEIELGTIDIFFGDKGIYVSDWFVVEN